jgi:hypothetical protein
MARPSATIAEIHDHCTKHLTEAMLQLSLLTGTVDERIADNA